MNREIEGIINYYIRINFVARNKVINYIRQLIIENQKLRNTIIHKHKYASEMEGKYILEKAKRNQLRSWLEEYKENASNSLDSYDCGIADCLGDILNKLNELENNYECKRDV